MDCEDYELNINPDTICRCCLDTDAELKTLFCREIVNGDVCLLPDVFKSVTELLIKKNDGLPPKVCRTCRQKLSEMYAFQQKCKNSDRLLRKVLSVDLNLAMADTSVSSTCTVIKAEQPIATKPLENQKEESTMPLEATATSETCKYVTIKEDAYNNDDVDEYHLDTSEILSSVVASNDSISDIEIERFDQFPKENMPDDTSYSIEYDNIEMLDDDDLPVDEERDIQSTADLTPETHHDTYFCTCCDQSMPLDKRDDHRLLHGQIMPKLMHSINYYRCGNCCTVFISVDTFSHHIESNTCHLSDIKYFSAAGDRHFSDEQTFYKVHNTFMPKQLHSIRKLDEYLYECDLCRSIINGNTADIQRHFRSNYHMNTRCTSEMLNHLVDAQVVHRCADCDTLFPNIVETFYHAYFHSTVYACPLAVCQLRYESFRLLANHLGRTKHGQATELQLMGSDELICNLCGKTFGSQRLLTAHGRSHQMDVGTRTTATDIVFEQQRHTCEKCGKSFAQACDLTVHIRTHTNVRPYKCGECGKEFRTVGQRNDHMSTHEKEKQFTCQVCDRKFISKRTLRGHMKTHEEQQFQCSVCMKKYTRFYHLKQHIKIHGIIECGGDN